MVNSGIYSELFRFRTFSSYTWLAHFSASSHDTQQTASSRLAPPSNFLIPSLTQVGGKPRTKQLTTKADESYDALLSTPTDAQFDIRSISSSRVSSSSVNILADDFGDAPVNLVSTRAEFFSPLRPRQEIASQTFSGSNLLSLAFSSSILQFFNFFWILLVP